MSTVCNRCKQAIAESGDSWCVSCSAVEQLRLEIAAPWNQKGLRDVAADLLVSAVRSVRALRVLSLGLAGASRASRPCLAGESRASGHPEAGLGRGRPSESTDQGLRAVPKREPVKDEPSEEKSSSEESGSEEETEDGGSLVEINPSWPWVSGLFFLD